jgi:hypothetical protein
VAWRAYELDFVQDLPASWNVEALLAAGTFVESKHPRKAKGQKGGGQFTVKTTNAEGKTGETSWDTKEQAEFDYKGVRDRAPFVVKGQLLDPEGKSLAKFDRSPKVEPTADELDLDSPLAQVPEYEGQQINSTEYSDRVGGAISRALEKKSGIIDLVHNDYVDDAVWSKWYAEGMKPTQAAKRFVEKGEGATPAGKKWLERHRKAAALKASADDEEGLQSAGFVESKHPRHKKGSEAGGQFAPKGAIVPPGGFDTEAEKRVHADRAATKGEVDPERARSRAEAKVEAQPKGYRADQAESRTNPLPPIPYKKQAAGEPDRDYEPTEAQGDATAQQELFNAKEDLERTLTLDSLDISQVRRAYQRFEMAFLAQVESKDIDQKKLKG